MSRARAVAWLAVLCAASAFGCARAPASSLLLCHNANCASPGTVERDDDLGALDASLALRLDGRPPFDGVELDTVWDAGAGRCLFAHGAGTPAPLLSEATDRIATLLAGEAPASWNGARFYLKIELKPDVAADGRAHSQAEAEAHADCVLDRLAEVERAAATRGRAVTALLDASDPTLLVTLTQRPRWPGKRAGGAFEIRLEVDYDTNVPAGFEPDVLTVRWGAIVQAMRDELRGRGKQVLCWGRDPSAETMADLSYLAPTFIGSNDALLMRAWLEGGR